MVADPNRYSTTGRNAHNLISFVVSALLRRTGQNSNNHNNELLVVAASAIVVVAFGSSLFAFWTKHYVMAYRWDGWDGWLMQIWDWNAHPPQIRRWLRVLDDVVCACDQAHTQLVVLEKALSRAGQFLQRLDRSSSRFGPGSSALASEPEEIRTLWELIASVSDLGTHLAIISHNLDQTAALVDEVPAMRGVVAPGADQIRCRKKALSNQVVLLMIRTDVLISVFQKKRRHHRTEAKRTKDDKDKDDIVDCKKKGSHCQAEATKTKGEGGVATEHDDRIAVEKTEDTESVAIKEGGPHQYTMEAKTSQIEEDESTWNEGNEGIVVEGTNDEEEGVVVKDGCPHHHTVEAKAKHNDEGEGIGNDEEDGIVEQERKPYQADAKEDVGPDCHLKPKEEGKGAKELHHAEATKTNDEGGLESVAMNEVGRHHHTEVKMKGEEKEGSVLEEKDCHHELVATATEAYNDHGVTSDAAGIFISVADPLYDPESTKSNEEEEHSIAMDEENEGIVIHEGGTHHDQAASTTTNEDKEQGIAIDEESEDIAIHEEYTHHDQTESTTMNEDAGMDIDEEKGDIVIHEGNTQHDRAESMRTKEEEEEEGDEEGMVFIDRKHNDEY